LPAEEEIAKCGKDWVCNVLATVANDEFEQFVRQQEALRKQEIDNAQRNIVSGLDA